MMTLILMLLCLHRTVLIYLCTVLRFALSLFLYACVQVRFSYVYSTRIQRVYAAVHSYSYNYLLVARCRMQPRRDIVFILLYMRSLPSSSSTVMYLVRLSYGCHAEGQLLTLLFLFGCCKQLLLMISESLVTA